MGRGQAPRKSIKQQCAAASISTGVQGLRDHKASGLSKIMSIMLIRTSPLVNWYSHTGKQYGVSSKH